MRLIDGDHLEERVRKIIKDYAQAAKDMNIVPGRVIFSSCGIIGLIQCESTVDAVPVVRCKDCTRWHKYNGEQFGECRWTFRVTKAEGYCDDAERKDDDND